MISKTSVAYKKLQKAVEDERYTVGIEACGYPELRCVVRFCGEFIGQSANLNDAIFIAICHQDERGLKLL